MTAARRVPNWQKQGGGPREDAFTLEELHRLRSIPEPAPRERPPVVAVEPAETIAELLDRCRDVPQVGDAVMLLQAAGLGDERIHRILTTDPPVRRQENWNQPG